MKAVNDSSTIDFAYLPSMSYTAIDDEVRVPLLHHAERTSPAGHDIFDGPVHRPTITTVNQDASHISTASAVTETKHEGLGELFEEMPAKLQEIMKEPAKAKGFLATIWSGLVDDVMGAKGMKAVKA